MQMAAPRATINTVPSYGSSAGVGYFRPTSAFPTSIKGQVSPARRSLFIWVLPYSNFVEAYMIYIP